MSSSARPLFNALQDLKICSDKVITNWSKLGNNRSNNLEKLASEFPDISSVSPIRESLKTLASFGIKDEFCLKLLTNQSGKSALWLNSHEISDSFHSLGVLGFEVPDQIHLVSSCPQLLSSSKNKISESYSWLKQTFTEKRAKQSIKVKPYLLLTEKEQLIERANYLFARMRVVTKEVAAAGALIHPVEKIRCRHLFLLRCGNYEFPNAKAKVKRLEKNPNIRDILDTSDREFATRIAGLSEEEFYIFKKLLNEEDKEAKNDDDELD